MKNKQDNRKLYEKILNATSQKDLDKIKVFNITKEQLKDFVPELDKIKDFILVLYDKIPKITNNDI